MEIIGKFRGERDDSRKFVDFTVMEVFRGDLDCRVEKEGNSKGRSIFAGKILTFLSISHYFPIIIRFTSLR